MGLLSFLFGKPDNEKLKEVIKSDAFLVDVRSAVEFASGSVKGAVNIPLGEISRHLSQFKNKKNTVVFCRSGNRSSEGMRILEQNGFQNIINGGTWQNVNSVRLQIEQENK